MKHAAPTISVVTPSLNQGAYIAEAIESVAAQDYPVLEHLVVDAGSSDGTLSVLERFEHLPHLKWTSEPDGGQSDGLNKGFRKARGDWVLWLNADDFLMPGVLRAYAGALAKRPNLDYLYGHTRFVDVQGHFLKTVYHIPYRHTLSAHFLYIPPTSGSLFRRSLLLQHPLDGRYHYIMDGEWFLRCGKTLRARRVNRVVNSFRVGDNKTAQSILTGSLTPQQVAEWRLLTETYRRDNPITEQSHRTAKTWYYLGKLRFGHRYLHEKVRTLSKARQDARADE